MNKLIHRQIDNIIVQIIAMAWYALWNKNYSAVEYGVGHDLEGQLSIRPRYAREFTIKFKSFHQDSPIL